MQSDDMARLISFTFFLTTEESVVREALASRHEMDILQLAALGLALRTRGDEIVAEMCGEEALRRFRGLVVSPAGTRRVLALMSSSSWSTHLHGLASSVRHQQR